ncbi:MAG: hypothetical protein IJU71_07510, partial [Selenomonadaceae bacterium]|nr:hypothetical protein [Selenomonadaceae bacterium]
MIPFPMGGGLADVSNVLILHEAATGDFVVMSAGIREIRRIWPSAHVTLVVDVRAESIAEKCPYIDELIVELFRINGKSMQGCNYSLQNLVPMFETNLGIAEKLLSRRFDIAFAIAHASSPTNPLLSYMSGAKTRISTIRDKNLFFPLITARPGKPHGTSHVDIALSCVEYITKKRVTERRLETWFSQDDLDFVRTLIPSNKKLYALGLGGGGGRKIYPPANYAALLNMLVEYDNEVKFVILAGPNERDAADVVMSKVDPERIIDLTGKISYCQTGAAL